MVFVGCGMVVATIMITFISAQPNRGDWWGTIANPLGLTIEQMDKLQGIVIEWQEVLLLLRSNLQTKKLELQRLIRNSKADPAVVEEMTREIGDLKTKMQRNLLERRAAIRELLTEEQWAQYDVQGRGDGFGRGPYSLGLGRV